MDLSIGLVVLFIYFLLLLNIFFLIFILITLFYFIIFFLSFIFFSFLLSHVADRVLAFWPSARSDPLRWECQAQDIGPPQPLRWECRAQDMGPPQTCRPHVISISESSPRDPHLNAKTQHQPMASKLQCWTPHAKKLARQQQNPIH